VAGLDLLAAMAHPDDAELLCGGALLAAADRGRATGVLDLTGGESGSAGSGAERAREADAAAALLGLATRRSAELPDGALENSPSARLRVAALLRELRPRTVIVHWPDARHPDHRAAAELVRDACFVAGLRRAPLDGEPFRPVKLMHALTYAEHAPRPSFVLDVSRQMERKLAAIFAYASQLEGRTALGDVFGGGGRPLREQILAHHVHYGSWIRRAYGEPYYTRETVRVEDVSALEVGSF
jgi:N-acetylglucosamine malate deacetylase 1